MQPKFNPGDIVAGLEPGEHVELRRVQPFGSKFLLEGVGVTSRREIRRPLSLDELSQLVKIRGADYAYDGDSEAFLMGVEANRIHIAYQFDPLFAVNSSVVDILPHQVEAVYHYLLPLPRIRFLLADDTGAGKTIMTGLLIKELLFRGVIGKVFIITPGGITGQWQDEMREKFGLSFRLINRASFEAEPAQFARSDDGLFVTSIDFISRHEGCLNAAKETQWDMIVVDEAHKLSAYEYGTKIDRSERYQAIESLTPRTDHLLFLTATPHRGRKDTFRRLLMLLDPDLFVKDEFVTRRIFSQAEAFEGEAAITKARNRFFQRRLKEDMVDWDGRPLFKPRHTSTVGYELTPEELELYNAVTKYVRSRRQEAKAKRNRNVELTLMVMQRRLASSIYAITRTLRNRLEALDKVIRILLDPSRSPSEKKRLLGITNDDLPDNIAEYEEMDEAQRESVEKRIFRQVLSDDPAEIEKERQEVAGLLRMAESLKNHPEAKFAELLSVLDSSDVIRREDEKLVIFTEHKDTLDNLTKRLTEKGYSVVTIHGGMDIDARKQAQREFRSRAKIMVATDAAGEGINLQFCRYLINWDIPWNPNRLEQRMGRIHRYGQRDEVWVYNLVAINTREGAVLSKVLQKLDLMREQMGTDRVYDVIDELLEDVPLVRLMERSIDDSDSSGAESEIERHLATGLESRAEDLVALQKHQALASKLNLREARKLRDDSDEQRLQPCFIQNFFSKAYEAAGGTIYPDKRFPVYHVGPTPSAILAIGRRQRLPAPDRYDHPFVFDKELVSIASRISVPEYTRLLGPGHPLFDSVIEWAISNARESFSRGVCLTDPNTASAQKVWLVRSRIEDGRHKERKRLAHESLSLVVSDGQALRALSPASLLNCTQPENLSIVMDFPVLNPEDVQLWAYEKLTDEQLQKVRADRDSECDIRRHYLETTFTDLILELQEKLNDLQRAQLFGDDNPDERRKLEQRLDQLRERKALRLSELEQMLRLSANLPDIVTSAIISPAAQAAESEIPRQGFPMRRDDVVERIAMDFAMLYERDRGWMPYDVSGDGEHYDIRSESPNGEKRFIEVKGRAQSGAIILTGAEADKLRQLAERAFLYIVTYCKEQDHRMHIIQNPMSKLTLQMLYRNVQYVIDSSVWLDSADSV
jgi:superfamily II DNA or RNA helicase